ncbi:MAG: hypothetical protein OXR62_07430 [Ahrensia sp.]|nr:hypothetical protein [Ahrensia sp.]
MSLRSTLIASLTIASFTLPAQASQDTDPVFVFNRICYAQVPNVDAIRSMALKLAWKQMGGEDLQRFASVDNPKSLDGWDAQVGERIYRVGLVQSGLTDQMKETFPGFANGKATSCTLVLDEEHDAAVFSANMQTLAGKEPISKDVPEDGLRTTTWAGGNDSLKVFLISKAEASGRGGVLSVTVLEK